MFKNSFLKYFLVVCTLISVKPAFVSASHKQALIKKEYRGNGNFFKKHKNLLIGLGVTTAILAAVGVSSVYAYKRNRHNGSPHPLDQEDAQLGSTTASEDLIRVANQPSDDFLLDNGSLHYLDQGNVKLGSVETYQAHDGSMLVGDSRSAGAWSRNVSVAGLKNVLDIVFNESFDSLEGMPSNDKTSFFAEKISRIAQGLGISSSSFDWFVDKLSSIISQDSFDCQTQDAKRRVIKSLFWNYLIGSWFLFNSDHSDVAWYRLYILYQSWPSGSCPTSWSLDTFKEEFSKIENDHGCFLNSLITSRLPNIEMTFDSSVFIP